MFELNVIAFIESNYAKDFAFSFLSVLFEGLPFIFFGTLISGFIDVYLPSNTLEKFLPKNKWLSILVCGLMGLVVPVCECTVVPVIRRLVAKGLPVGSAFAYMLAAPIVNPISIFSTYTAFSGEPVGMALSRAILGYLVAVIIGMIILFLPIEKILKKSVLERLHFSGKGHSHSKDEHKHKHKHKHDKKCQTDGVEASTCGHDHAEESCEESCEKGCDHHEHHDHGQDKVVGALRTSVRDFVDVGVYFTVGITLMTIFKLGANTNTFLNYLADEGSLLEGTAFMIGLSFVLSLCSTSDAFIVATSFERLGRVPKMAFLVFGPMMDMKLLFLYQTLMRWRAVLLMTVLLFIMVTAVSILWGECYPAVMTWAEKLIGT